MKRPLTAPPSNGAPQSQLPSLRELLERARQPDASTSDVGSLIESLSPDALTEVMTPRERANLLLEVLRDVPLGRRKDRGGREVRRVAAEALLALGSPYAMELPAEALPSERREPLTPWGLLAPLLVLGAGLTERWLFSMFLGRDPELVRTPPPLPQGMVVCGTGLHDQQTVMNVVLAALLLAFLGFVQGGAALGALVWGRRTALKWGARVQWAGCAVRGALCAFFWFTGSGLLGSTDQLASAASTVLLVTGVAMGLAGLCLRPRPEEEAR